MGRHVAILLDTHVLIWAFEDNPRLGTRAIGTIDAATTETKAIGYAAISVWEIAMLYEKGRLTLSRSLDKWMAIVIDFEKCA